MSRSQNDYGIGKNSSRIAERDICKSCVLREYLGGEFFLQDSVIEGPSFDDVNDLFVAV